MNELFIKLFQQHGKDKALGGYLAYPKDDGNQFVFYDTNARVIAEAFFDSTFKTPQSSISFIVRDFNPTEEQYYKIKMAVKKFQTKDSSIRYYENTGMNEIPVILYGKQKCYLLTAPKYLGQVIYGNDYYFELDKNYKVTKFSDLHKTIVPVPYALDSLHNSSYHTHSDEVGYLPTASDIAITYLYGDLAGWVYHYIQTSELLTIIDVKNRKVQISRVPNPIKETKVIKNEIDNLPKK